MKQLFTLCLAFMSVTAMAQWPSLPYNPDENGDGLIGVVDLAALLAQYNTEFASAVVSEDGESAIVYMGNSKQIQCKYDCAHLPGSWHLPEPYELVPVLNELAYVNGSGCTYAWISDYGKEVTNNTYFYRACNYQGSLQISAVGFETSARCYCAAKQLPRVEYSYCMTSDHTWNVPDPANDAAAFQACCDAKVQDGWYPLGGLSKGHNNDGGQAFWRWAE